MKRNILCVVLLCIMIHSCTTNRNKAKTINGLWLVTKVKIGKEENTRVARWMQFNKDNTQISGNGWLKHSEGVYTLNPENELLITNSNGLLDKANPFLIDLKANEMTWSRAEEGKNVQVFLKKIDKRPTSSGNKLMGLWKLDSIKLRKNIKDKFNSFDPNPKAYLFIRWDDTYINQLVPGVKKYGIYKIHGHKPELQMVNYGESPEFKYYRFKFNKVNLILTSTQGKTELVYSRIYQFPK